MFISVCPSPYPASCTGHASKCCSSAPDARSRRRLWLSAQVLLLPDPRRHSLLLSACRLFHRRWPLAASTSDASPKLLPVSALFVIFDLRSFVRWPTPPPLPGHWNSLLTAAFSLCLNAPPKSVHSSVTRAAARGVASPRPTRSFARARKPKGYSTLYAGSDAAAKLTMIRRNGGGGGQGKRKNWPKCLSAD